LRILELAFGVIKTKGGKRFPPFFYFALLLIFMENMRVVIFLKKGSQFTAFFFKKGFAIPILASR